MNEVEFEEFWDKLKKQYNWDDHIRIHIIGMHSLIYDVYEEGYNKGYKEGRNSVLTELGYPEEV